MSITPSTRGLRDDIARRELPQTPKTEHTVGGDETQLRRILSRIGARPVGHAEQVVDENPAPPAAQPDPDRPPVAAARQISTERGGGRLPAPGQTIELTDPAEQHAPADQPTLPEDQDATAGRPQIPDARTAGGATEGGWPPRAPWHRHQDGDQGEAPVITDVEENAKKPEDDEPDWFRVQKTEDQQVPDPGTYEVHNHYYGSGPDSVAPPAGEGTGPSRINRGSLTAWWASRTPWQRFILHNGSAAAVGAWGWGMFTARWDTGLPQWTLAVMHDAAASSNQPSTPLIVGGGMVLLAAVIGGGVTRFVEKWLHRLPSFCVAVRFLTHVPVASAGIAVLLFSTSTI